MPRTRKKNPTPKRPTKSGVRGRGTYTGRRGAARGSGGAAAAGVPGVAGAASMPAVVKEAPQYRQKREVSLFIVPHASQRIEGTRVRIPGSGFELWVVTCPFYRKRK